MCFSSLLYAKLCAVVVPRASIKVHENFSPLQKIEKILQRRVNICLELIVFEIFRSVLPLCIRPDINFPYRYLS